MSEGLQACLSFLPLSRSALATVPTNAKIHFNYANFLKDIGRRQEAVQFYQTAVRYGLSVFWGVVLRGYGMKLSGLKSVEELSGTEF